MNKDEENHNSISLKEYIEAKIGAVEKATTIASANLEKRLEGMNEFREALKDQTAKFITRNEHEAMMNNYNKDIRELRESRAMLEGKANQSSLNIVLGVSLVAILISIIDLIIRFIK